jgi:hypothetical protein
MLATILLGVAGQAAWKLATYIYDRVTAAGSSPTSASAPGSFERSLAEVTSPGAVAAPTGTPAVARLPQAAAIPEGDAGSFGAGRPAMASVIDIYHRMSEVQAP